MITTSDLVTLGRPAGVSMVNLLLEGGRLGSTGGHCGSSRAHHSIVVEPPPSGSESMALSTSEIELIRSMTSWLDTSANTHLFLPNQIIPSQ